ncbi:hypothetical protein WN944_022169 [Citrus x changshan-huyou]|uniref:NB-ARC domain-containing protein n=1 Tax=Citrus x changshan-huyou TaxID=2935761 RepID=A0AAP0MY05_9ROSI
MKDQTSKGHFDVVADPQPPPVVEILPKENNIVGIESRLSEVWRYIEDDGVKIISLYGVRGVGKSTLLKQLNDMFSDMSHKFGAVIMVKASTELNVGKIQEVIRSRLGIDPDGDKWKNRDDQGRAAEIFRRLSNKKFALLLDDLRERIELSEAGVPVTDDVLNSHPDIRELAETVADMCGDLPLALVTIGSAMASRRDPDNWRYAIEELQRYPSGFEVWIASSQVAKKILVFQETDKSIKEQETASWKEAVRVSLWRSPSIDSLSPTPPCCPRLLTLLVRYTMIKEFENKFFKSMHALRVLDSSQNAKLSKLHVGEGELIDLQYLNFSNTNICELPIGIKSCTQLRTLLLDGTENLNAIPVGMLSSLLSLRVFSWVPTRYAGFNYGSSVPGVTVLLREELESLKHLQEISVIILTLDSLNKLKSSSKLQSCVRRLVMGLPELSSLIDISSSSLTTMMKGQFSQNLQDLSIINCSMKDLTCILDIPRLRFLFAKDCPSLE